MSMTSSKSPTALESEGGFGDWKRLDDLVGPVLADLKSAMECARVRKMPNHAMNTVPAAIGEEPISHDQPKPSTFAAMPWIVITNRMTAATQPIRARSHSAPSLSLVWVAGEAAFPGWGPFKGGGITSPAGGGSMPAAS